MQVAPWRSSALWTAKPFPRCPSGRETLDEAVAAARRAFTSWSKATIKERVQVFFRFRNLLEKHKSELTELIRLENGKTYGEAEAEVLKGIELSEFACSLP
ncbi:MAG TPA: aldehyde dehydrogenase family protein, partial [Saprospiraceae bacterium]|nr:aldehyde dehydrogenase family protein [Saprospiraceae bacterium]